MAQVLDLNKSVYEIAKYPVIKGLMAENGCRITEPGVCRLPWDAYDHPKKAAATQRR